MDQSIDQKQAFGAIREEEKESEGVTRGSQRRLFRRGRGNSSFLNNSTLSSNSPGKVIKPQVVVQTSTMLKKLQEAQGGGNSAEPKAGASSPPRAAQVQQSPYPKGQMSEKRQVGANVGTLDSRLQKSAQNKIKSIMANLDDSDDNSEGEMKKSDSDGSEESK